MPYQVKPWKLISSVPALEEKWFPVRKDTVELPSGRIVEDYFVWEAPHIVKVIPITKDGKFVVCRQYRHALAKILTQFPAGAVDKGEALEQGARRELQEETGYTCNELVHLGSFAPYATKMTGITDIFLAQNATPNGEPQYDDQEETEVCLMTAAEIWKLIGQKEPHMIDLPAALALAEHYLQSTPQK